MIATRVQNMLVLCLPILAVLVGAAAGVLVGP